MTSRRWWWSLGGIVVVALVLRLALAISVPTRLFGDATDYQRHAVWIATAGHYPPTELASPGTPSAFRPPGYPYLLGGLYAVIGVHPTAARALGAVLGALCVALLGLLARILWSPRIGLLAAGLGAGFLPLIVLDGSVLSESLFLPLEMAFVLTLAVCVRRRVHLGWALLAGATCGLAVLTRAAADVWVVVAILAAALAAPGVLPRLRQGAAVLAAFLLVLSPWLIRDALAFHQFVPVTTEGGLTLAGQYNAQAGRDDALEAVYRLPTSQVPDLARQVRRLLQRPGGINEAQLDGVLRSDAVHYFKAHPVHLAVAVWLDSLRMFDLGRAHTFTTGIAYHELNVPGWLRRPTTIFAQAVAVIDLLLIVALLVARGPLSRPLKGLPPSWRAVRLGPWWLWAIPILTLALTVPSVGNELKRAPLDPFLLLLSALALDALIPAVLPLRARVARQRRTQRARS